MKREAIRVRQRERDRERENETKKKGHILYKKDIYCFNLLLLSVMFQPEVITLSDINFIYLNQLNQLFQSISLLHLKNTLSPL